MRNFYHTILINIHRIIYYVAKARIWLLNVDGHTDEERYALANEMITKMNRSSGYETLSFGQENNRNIVEDFKAGSFKVAQMAKVPIVPVALVDSYKVYNSDEHIGPTKTFVYYLKPIHYDEYKNMRTNEIAAMVRQRIVYAINRHFSDRTLEGK